jgi:hypothetical protein
MEEKEKADKELADWFDEYWKQKDKLAWLTEQAKLAKPIEKEDLDKCRLMCVCKGETNEEM